jgi:hypothetical protein
MGLHGCAIEIAGSCFLFCFELLNSPLQSFNPSFHVLVDLGGISIIKFIRSVLPHVASDDHYQSVTQSRKWTNCPSTKVEANRTRSLSAAVTEESHPLRALVVDEPPVLTRRHVDGAVFSTAAKEPLVVSNGPSRLGRSALLAFHRIRNSFANPAYTEPVPPSSSPG